MAAAKFHLVSPSIWDRRLRQSSIEAKLVALNVMTCRSRASEGLFELAAGHVAADTGLTVDQVEEALDELHAVGIVRWDPAAEVVLDPLALRTNPLRNGVSRKTGEVIPDGRMKTAVGLFERLVETDLKREFLELADLYSPDLAAAIREQVDPRRVPSVTPPQGGPQGGPPTGPQGGASSSEASTYRVDHEPSRDRGSGSEVDVGSAPDPEPGRGDFVMCQSCGGDVEFCGCPAPDTADVIAQAMPWANVQGSRGAA